MGDVRQNFRRALARGSLFEGKYRIVDKIGEGSFAYVLRARHEVMDRDVAMKVLRPEIVQGHPEVAERFVHEARIVSKLKHPHTVTVFDFGTTDTDISYMVMEFVIGTSLEAELEKGAMSEQRVAHITKQILKSLDEAHDTGVIHRDLKPSNIMLTEVHGETDFVKVLDFGVAKLVEDEARRTQAKRTRRSTQFVGTPIYMSPEQVLGEPITPASDLYSLGLLVYEMLTGETPVEGKTVGEVVQNHIAEEPLPFPKLNLVSERFQKLVLKATARDPRARFRSVQEFARQLPRIDSADYSDEFAVLLGEPEDDDFDELFSGRGYIEPPPIEETEPPRRRPSRPRPEPAPAPRRQPARREELKVDHGRIRRDEIRRDVASRREADRSNTFSTSSWQRDGVWITVGVLSLLFVFHVTSTVYANGGASRVFIGLIPLAGAILAVQFSPMRRIGRGFREDWVLPLSRNLLVALVIVMLVTGFLIPEDAASRMKLAGGWMVADAPADSVVRRGVEGIAEGFAGVFSFASSIKPW